MCLLKNLNQIFFFYVALGDCKLSCLEPLYVGPKTMVALSLAELPGNTDHIVLAMGGLDNMVHLYCGERKGKVCNCELIFLFLFYAAYDLFL